MNKVTVPKNEQGRIAALKLYEILDTLPEQEFDNLAQLAAEICNTPIALISLVDEQRQWVKSRVGIDTVEIPRDYSFCHYTILDDEIFEVVNPLADSRFDRNPLVTGHAGIRFYAGVPLVNRDGYRLGALCVMSPKHHQLNSYQRISIQILASSAMSLLELRRERKEAAMFKTALNEFASVSLLDGAYNVLFVNELFCRMTGLGEAELIGRNNNEIKLADITTDEANSILDSVRSHQPWRGRIKNQNIKGVVTWSNLAVLPFVDKDNEVTKILYVRNDVTDEVLVRERLTESEQLAKTGSWELNIFSRNTYWSPGMYALLDYDQVREGQNEQSIMNFIAPVDFERVNEANKRLLEKKTSFDKLEFKIVTSKGREKDINAVVRKRFNSKGGLTGIYGTLCDITETRAAERAALEKDEQVFDLYNNAPCGYFSLDEQGYVTDINNTAIKWIGHTREDVINRKTVMQLLAAVSTGNAAEDLAQLRNTGHLKETPWTFTRADGSLLPTTADAVTIYDKQGRFRHMHFTIQQKSEVSLLSEKLNESGPKALHVAHGHEHMLLILDHEGKCTYVSSRLQKLTGFTAIGLSAKPFAFAFDEEYRTKAIRFYAKQLASLDDETTFLMPVKDTEGAQWWMDITGALVEQDHLVTGIRCTLYDVTERVKKEQALNEVAWIAMEARDKQQTLLQQIKYDVQSPLEGVMGMVNLLSTTSLSAEQKVLLSGIKESAANTVKQLQQLLDNAGAEPAQIVFRETEFELKQLVNNVIFTLKPAADKKDIRLILQIDNKIPVTLIADKDVLSKVLTCLAGNAIKYTQKGSVSISVFQRLVQNGAITLEFVVKDTGVGIAADRLASIFDSLSEPVAGISSTGLGLMVARQLVEQQNGELKVRSTEGVGSTFSFTFHCKWADSQVAPSPAKEQNEEETSLSGVNILLVEDNMMSQRIGRATLENWGATVTVAELGRTAIRLMKDNRYDIVLMDLQMPEMGGIEATTIIRNELRDTTPIMGMTVSEMQASREMCLNAGMNDYILKPLKPVELHQKIFALLRKPELKLVEKVINTEYVKEKITNINFARNITGNDIPLIREILELYISKTPALVEELEMYIATQNYKMAQAGAHYLKNSVGLLGADTLFHMLASIEYQLNHNPPSYETLALFGKMKVIIAESIEETIEELSRL